jgi:hypothetical protein
MLSRIATDPWPCIDFIFSEPRTGMNEHYIMDACASLGTVRTNSLFDPITHHAEVPEGTIRYGGPFMPVRGSEYF